MNAAIGLLLSLGWAMSAFAEEAPQKIAPFPRSCSASPYGEICLHAFGGRETVIPLSHLRAELCDGATWRLFQLSDRLAMPIGEAVALPASHCEEAVVTLPDVQEKTIFRVSVKTANNNDSADTLLAVYPRDLWEALRTWSRQNQIVVNDRSGKLSRILDAHAVIYSPIPQPEKKLAQVCVWVPGKEVDPPFDCPAMLVLHEAPDGLPSVDTRQGSGKRRTDVHMPMLDALESNPLVQETFIQLVQSTLEGE